MALSGRLPSVKRRLVLCLLLVLWPLGCASGVSQRGEGAVAAHGGDLDGSIDGTRHDYVDHYHLSFFLLRGSCRLGAYTRQLVPVFPSPTFPSHASEITGAVDVQTHGITSNTFYASRATWRLHKLASSAACCSAESLWVSRTCWM